MNRAAEAIQTYTEAAYAILVAGAALVWPPLALLCAGGYLIALAVVADRRSEGQP
jgi:hypothetical protein